MLADPDVIAYPAWCEYVAVVAIDAEPEVIA